MGVILTGPPGIGKTTAIKAVVAQLRNNGVSVAGFYTEEERKGGSRVGFIMVNAATGERRRMAGVNGTGVKFGKYFVDLSVVDWGIKLLNGDGNVVVIDEVGPMENLHPGFIAAVENGINERISVLTVHERLLGLITGKAMNHKLIRLSISNRDEVPRLVVNHILELLGQ